MAKLTMLRGDGSGRRKSVGTLDIPGKVAIDQPVRPEAPAGIVPLDQTPRPDGLAVDETIRDYGLARMSPFRSRWPDVHAFDERVRKLETKQANLNAELVELAEVLRRAEVADDEARARWAADDMGERPTPTAPAVAQRIEAAIGDRDALTLAMRRTLDEKIAFVGKHRKRLVREARDATSRAVERLDAAITAVEQARDEAAACVAAEHWATSFPGEGANGIELRLGLMLGGRLTRSVPDYKGLAAADAIVSWLRDDAAWLLELMRRTHEERPLDPHEQAVWEQSPEGREAVVLANKRVAQGLAARDAMRAEWQ